MTLSKQRYVVERLALGISLALGLPVLSHAQTSSAAGSASGSISDDQQLEARMDQLQQEVAELKRMIQAERTGQARAVTVAPEPMNKAAPVFTSARGISVALHGFIDASAFSQSKTFTFGNGQNAEYPVAGSNGSPTGFDVRNTRFWLDFGGAQFTGNWTGGGRIEMDFFGGYNGTGAYSQQQPIPRLRQAYMDLTNATTGSTIRIGQQ